MTLSPGGRHVRSTGWRRPALVALVAGAFALAGLGFAPSATADVQLSGASMPWRAGSVSTAAATNSAATKGHLHLLPGPRRIANSATGQLFPRGRVPARKTTSLRVTGRVGLPTRGVKALAVVVSTTHAKGATSIRVGNASTPVLVTHPGTSSAFTIAPVNSGMLALRVGAHATDVRLDVVGWFSANRETAPAGLFNALPERELPSLTVPARTKRTLKVAGIAGVPSGGVSSVLGRVTVVAPRRGTLTVGAAGTSASSTATLVYRAGRSADLALVRLGAHGKVVIRNRGTRAVTILFQPRGWFTDGKGPSPYGDTLHLTKAFRATSKAKIDRSGFRLGVCGRNGIPGQGTRRPTSVVLALAKATRASKATNLSADPDGATAVGAPQLIVRRGQGIAGLLALPPSGKCRTRVATSTSSVRAIIEPYAWFSGGTVISSRLQLLSPKTLKLISSVDENQLTFTGDGPSLPLLSPGDIVSAGISLTTPTGLLRRVLTVTHGDGTLTVTTDSAAIDDAITQGSISIGAASTAPHVRAVIPATARTTRITPSQPARINRLGLTVGECDVGGSPVGFGLTLSCSHSYNPGTGVTIDATGSQGWALGLDLDIRSGFHLPTHVSVSFSQNVAAKVTATSSVGDGVDESVNLLSKEFEPIVVFIGEVPLVLVPVVTADLTINGQVTASLTGQGEMRASASLGYDSSNGATASVTRTGNGSVSHQSENVAQLKVGLKASVAIDVYGIKRTNIHMGAEPFVQLKADQCAGHVDVGAKFFAGISVGITRGISVSKNFSKTTTFGTVPVPLRNCAIWGGTMTIRRNSHVKNDLGRPVADVQYSVSVALTAPPGGVPPLYDQYSATGSGSGAEIRREFVCGGPPPNYYPTVSNTTWGGPIEGAASENFAFSPSITPGFTVLQTNWGGEIAGTESYTDCDGKVTAGATMRDSGFFLLPDANAGPPLSDGDFSLIAFSTPAGRKKFSGSRVLDTEQAYGGTDHIEFTYSFTKTCTMGGTAC